MPTSQNCLLFFVIEVLCIFFLLAQTAIVAKAGKWSIKSSQSNPKIQQLGLCFP